MEKAYIIYYDDDLRGVFTDKSIVDKFEEDFGTELIEVVETELNPKPAIQPLKTVYIANLDFMTAKVTVHQQQTLLDNLTDRNTKVYDIVSYIPRTLAAYSYDSETTAKQLVLEIYGKYRELMETYLKNVHAS